MERLFLGDAREQRYVDAIADQADIDVMPADREQAECQLQHGRCAGTVDNRVDVGLAGESGEPLCQILRAFALDADRVIDAELLSGAHALRKPSQVGVDFVA